MRRKTNGNNPVMLARRITAALNAPDMIRVKDFNFFWLTAVTTDGDVVAANNYGIDYIPHGIQLPEQVRMAGSDGAIAIAERARWATHPVLALPGWAAHHNKRLRAIIGTREQLEGFDPGVHKDYLEPDDIPDSGKMQGRNRLQVVYPEAAAYLAALSDADLPNELPPAGADTNPPEDRRDILWMDVFKPLMSNVAGRETAHLQAFQTYSAHAADMELYRAHTAADAPAQRAAIIDWYYWLYQYDTATAALSESQPVAG